MKLNTLVTKYTDILIINFSQYTCIIHPQRYIVRVKGLVEQQKCVSYLSMTFTLLTAIQIT